MVVRRPRGKVPTIVAVLVSLHVAIRSLYGRVQLLSLVFFIRRCLCKAACVIVLLTLCQLRMSLRRKKNDRNKEGNYRGLLCYNNINLPGDATERSSKSVRRDRASGM